MQMARETELYRLELESASRIFGSDEFLSISELSRRLRISRATVYKMLGIYAAPVGGISKAQYALAISKERRR